MVFNEYIIKYNCIFQSTKNVLEVLSNSHCQITVIQENKLVSSAKII